MPTYPYRCTACNFEFEVVKPLRDIDDPERCEKCSSRAERFISRTHFYGASDWDTATFNPGLGCVTRSNKHARQIAKQRGLEEVGTTPAADLIKDADSTRQRRMDERWAAA